MSIKSLRWLPKFRLSTIFFSITIVALVGTLVLTNLKWDSDIQELQRLRDVAGELTISDDAKLQAIGIPKSNPNEWKWHVYLPTDRDYQVHLVVGKIPSRGVPERLSGTPQMRSGFAKSGEMIIGASLDHDSDDQ